MHRIVHPWRALQAYRLRRMVKTYRLVSRLARLEDLKNSPTLAELAASAKIKVTSTVSVSEIERKIRERDGDRSP